MTGNASEADPVVHMSQVRVVLAGRTSFRPAAVLGLSSSPSGTVFVSDRTGAIRVYFRPAPFGPTAQYYSRGFTVCSRLCL